MLTVIIGPMFSGKSIELIRQVNRQKVAGRRVIVFKFSADNRYAQTAAASYDGFSTWAIPAASSEEIVNRIDPAHDVIVIDEIQFFDEPILDLLVKFIQQDKDVIVAGLNLDFRGEPFVFRGGGRSMADLVVRADAIFSLQAICTAKSNDKICGAMATRTQRLRDGEPVPYEDPLIQIGSTESYEARCLRHHCVPHLSVEKKI